MAVQFTFTSEYLIHLCGCRVRYACKTTSRYIRWASKQDLEMMRLVRWAANTEPSHVCAWHKGWTHAMQTYEQSTGLIMERLEVWTLPNA